MGGQPVQHLFDQVIDHKAIAAAERGHKGGMIRTVLHGQRGQLQAGDPALGTGLQRRHLVAGQRQPHHHRQECSGFVGGKA